MAWLGSWAKRRQLTIAAADVDNDLTDFPMHVRLESAAGKTNVDVTDIFDDLGSSSQKIAFTQSDGTTQLYAEVVYWDSTGEVAEIHVKVPSLTAASGGSIYLYYDAAQPNNTTYIGTSPNDTASNNVWVDFEMVMHFNETSGSYLDSTSHSKDATVVSVNSRTANGFFNNNSPDFNEAANNYCKGSGLPDWPASKVVEALVLTDTVDSGYNPIMNHRSGTNWFQLGRNGSSCHWRWHDSATNRRFDFGTISTGTWYHIVGSLNASTAVAYGYLNGVQQTSQSSAGIPATSATTYLIAQYSTSEDWDGRLDELRVSGVWRNGGWIAATNDTLRDNFHTWSASEDSGWSAGNVNSVSNASIGKVDTVERTDIAKVDGV